MKITIWLLCMVALLIGSVYFGFWSLRDENCVNVYAGEIEFSTEEEYNEFKRQVNQDGVSWRKMDVLASDPPIYVHFSVRAPIGTEIDFGGPPVRDEALYGAFLIMGFGAYLVSMLCFAPRAK